MNKKLLAGMIAVMTLSGVSASVNEKGEARVDASRDTRIIVEAKKGIENLSKDEIYSSQDKVMREISKKVTSNFKLVDRYSVLNNAFVVEINSNDVEAIRALDSVASVTIDKIHAKRDINDGQNYSVSFARPVPVDGEDTGLIDDNISAVTMKKTNDTNDGEGTVVAILDNEFYLRGAHDPVTETKNGVTTYDDGTPWNHVVFKPLGDGVAKKFTFDNLTAKVANPNSGMHAQRTKDAEAGDEGSLYYNDKVPFYYDYGGESKSYGKVGDMDYDVSSTIAYHGSHVASITAANADTYKGIAPKAQLACMKVFTNYEASKTGEGLGFGDSSGAYDSTILAAVEDAIILGVDGINMSLGSDLDDFDTDSITMQTLSRLANDAGILSAISAGNAGKSSYTFTGGYGNWTTDMVETGILGSYANSTENMIIASGQPTQIYYENALELYNKDGEAIKNVAYEDQVVNREGLDADFDPNAQKWMTDLVKDKTTDQYNYDQEIEWVYIPGFGLATDYKDELLDMTGKVAVVNRGSNSFSEKVSIAAGRGARAVVIINNDPTATDFNFRCSFGEDTPTIPVALALYRDRNTFETNKSGTFKFISKKVSANDLSNTISTYSTDGARFDYALIPDITTPGENIRGAVPPQKKEHKENTPLSSYEYLSGTSMAAPNYAGAQSVVLSKFAKDVYADGNATDEELESLKAFRKTVDLRLMSTAMPMLDPTVNPEDSTIGVTEEKPGFSYTSPRMQGAGMVDLGKAYHTGVYLDGYDKTGTNRINKSKIQLFNNDDIARGTLNLSFAAINETSSDETYTAKVTIMRPAITKNNKVLNGQYSYRGEIGDLKSFPGFTYVEDYYVSGKGMMSKLTTNEGTDYVKNDVIKVTTALKYYDAVQDPNTSIENYDESSIKILEPGYYYNSSDSGCHFEALPDYEYQSVQDVKIDEFTQVINVPANSETKITLNSYSLSEDIKNNILAKFPYGCAIEGYVELMQNGERQLSMPYLGFYSGLDKSSKNTLKNAPVVEPFDFEKDPTAIYPSDLVNDVTLQLVGKQSASFGSTWVAGYAESTMDINTDSILTNDSSFDKMGFNKVGLNPATGKYFDNPGNSIYVGNPQKTNTMIITQFVLRSVSDNFFTIKDSQGNIVYKSVLEDMLFGDKQLYKSHVDSSYLGAGYVAHRAMAIIPLYDVNTLEAFATGRYTIEFNYQLAYDGSWVSKSYNFVIDSSTPEITSIKEYDSNGSKRVRIEVKDLNICKAVVGYGVYYNFQYDADKDVYYIDETKQYFEDSINELDLPASGKKRLYLSFTDAAYGTVTAIVHFFGDSFSNYVIAQGNGLSVDLDFNKDGENVTFVKIDFDGFTTEVNPTSFITIKTVFGEDPEHFIPGPTVEYVEETVGCGGSILASTVLLTTAALAGAGLVSLKKRREEKEEN